MSIATKIGFKVVELINEQVAAGVDIDGKSYEYSTRPFAMPAGKKRFAKYFYKPEDKGGRLGLFATKNGKLWQLVYGGYADWRAMNNKNPKGDFLQWTGQMMRSLSAREMGEGKAMVYFADASAAQKAFWFNVSGVGRSRKLWKFFGLTKANEDKLYQYAVELLSKEGEDIVVRIVKDFNFVE